MPHPIPESPTNVQHTNPYVGVDRGLMVLRGRYTGFARIHAARWICSGPPGGVSRLEFKVMRYATMPTTPAEYAAGTLLKAPDNSEWFDCVSKGDCTKPIMVEYYARNVFQTYYMLEGDIEMLSDEQKTSITAQALEFTKTIGRKYNIREMELVAAFNATSTTPLTLTSRTLEFTYGPDNAPKDVTLTTLVEDDPVREVIRYIKSQPQ